MSNIHFSRWVAYNTNVCGKSIRNFHFRKLSPGLWSKCLLMVVFLISLWWSAFLCWSWLAHCGFTVMALPVVLNGVSIMELLTMESEIPSFIGGDGWLSSQRAFVHAFGLVLCINVIRGIFAWCFFKGKKTNPTKNLFYFKLGFVCWTPISIFNKTEEHCGSTISNQGSI